MKKFLILITAILLGLPVFAQDGGGSFLVVNSFKITPPTNTFILPEGMKKKDINNKPWAMIKVLAKGFDEKILKEITVYSPSSTLQVENVRYNDEEGSLKIILSSGVKGKLVFKYKGAVAEYQIMEPLVKSRVYQMELVMRSATLTVVATPAEATVSIDGVVSDKKGIAIQTVSVGDHTYSVECENYMPEVNRTVSITDDQVVNVNLKPLFGYITINSMPQGANVYIDGVLSGTTPYVNKAIKRGENNIELKMDSYGDYAQLVNIISGNTEEIYVVMVSESEAKKQITENFVRNEVLKLSKDTLSFGPEFSLDSVYVTTNSMVWSFDSVPEWCSVYHKGNKLLVACNENMVHDSRCGDVKIYTENLTKKLHIVQEVGRTFVNTRTNSLVFDSGKDTIRIKIETNVLDWGINVDKEWCHAYQSSDTLVVVCEENTTPVSRHGKVDIIVLDKMTQLNVVQKSQALTLDVSKNNINFKADGGCVNVCVSTDNNDWTLESDGIWFNIQRKGNSLRVECEPNNSYEREGSFVIKTATCSKKIIVQQSGIMYNKVKISTKPNWERIYIDNKYVGRTPYRFAIDDSIHNVRLGDETKSFLFNGKEPELKFRQGMRYLTFTISEETVGVMTGFIGGKHMGAFTHFQFNLDNSYFNPKSEINPLYILGFGPSVDLFPCVSIYAGAGVSLNNDTMAYHLGGAFEAGLLFYYRKIFVTGGVQMYGIGLENSKMTYTAGAGLYFNRYYDKKHIYRSDFSRRVWSLNFVMNPVLENYGVMFSDVGRGKVRWYFKTMLGIPTENLYNLGVTTGLVLNAPPSFIDFIIGGGYEASISLQTGNSDTENIQDEQFVGKGAEAELGVVINLWRFPLTMMFRYCEIGQSLSYLAVDFGIGFSFGKMKK